MQSVSKIRLDTHSGSAMTAALAPCVLNPRRLITFSRTHGLPDAAFSDKAVRNSGKFCQLSKKQVAAKSRLALPPLFDPLGCFLRVLLRCHRRILHATASFWPCRPRRYVTWAAQLQPVPNMTMCALHAHNPVGWTGTEARATSGFQKHASGAELLAEELLAIGVAPLADLDISAMPPPPLLLATASPAAARTATPPSPMARLGAPATQHQRYDTRSD